MGPVVMKFPGHSQLTSHEPLCGSFKPLFLETDCFSGLKEVKPSDDIIHVTHKTLRICHQLSCSKLSFLPGSEMSD